MRIEGRWRGRFAVCVALNFDGRREPSYLNEKRLNMVLEAR